MRRLMTSAIAALALAGSTFAGVTAANAAIGFYVGPGGVHVQYGTGYYRHHRYVYPNDWRDYHHPLGWYRMHRDWYTARDWYRR